MHSKYQYRNAGFLLIIIDLILDQINPESRFLSDIIKLLDSTIVVAICFLFLMWINKLILLIAFILTVITFNLNIGVNELFPNNEYFSFASISMISFRIKAAATVLFIVGLIDSIKLGKLTELVSVNPQKLILFTVVSTSLFQLLIRL